MTLEELEKLVEINKHALDDECNKQSQLFWEACKGWAEALDKRDTAKHKLQVISAQIAASFRAGSLEKVTEAKITEHVQSHPDYIVQLQFIDQFSKEASLWIGMKEVFEGRRWMLIEMSRQQQMGYFGVTSDLDKIEALKTAYRQRKDGITDAK
jgi:hypothetical protein